MNKELADKVLAAARASLGLQCEMRVCGAYNGTDWEWCIMVSAPNVTGHAEWLSTWPRRTLEELLEEVEAYQAKQASQPVEDAQRIPDWIRDFTSRMGRG